MAVSETKLDFGLPDLSSLSESERLQLLAVMQKAKEFEATEEMKNKNYQPLEGQLTKFTNVMKGWLHRWFILDPESGMLEYFEKEEHKKMRPRGSIHLGAAVISPSDEDSQTFTVSAINGEVFRLRAVDAKERQQWVDRLRSTAEYQAAHIAQGALTTSLGGHREARPATLNSPSSPSVIASKSRRTHTISSGSNEHVHRGQVATQSQPRPHHPPPPTPQIIKAPAARPHTIDPFLEVKEYMIEAEDYSHSLNDKINFLNLWHIGIHHVTGKSLPQTGDVICGLDPELLLMKATSSATLQCLGQCLTMLQQRQSEIKRKQDAHGDIARTSVGTSIDVAMRRPVSLTARSCSMSSVGHVSPTGSFSSANSLPYVLSEPSTTVVDREDEVEDEAEYRDSELEGMEEHKFIILHLLSQLKLGMDLTKVVLPTFILERRSLLELFADCMAHPDIFLKITELQEPEERMMGVLEWYLTSFHAGRQGSIAKKPYNPIIGETFHCSWLIPPSAEDQQNKPYYMTYCAEQVSHHPPVSAFYFECPKKNVSVSASIYTKSKFMGMSIGVVMVGKVTVRLLDYDEEYVFGLPSAYARSILTTPWVELGDKIQMTCHKTNYSAAVTFHTKPFYGGKLHRVTAEMKNGNTGVVVCKAQGEWNSNIEFTYVDQEAKVVDVNSNPIWRKRVRPLSKQGEFESRRLWHHVTNALKAGDVNTATEHKKFLEERQREGERHRKDTNTQFPTQFFTKVGDTWIYKNMLQKSQTTLNNVSS